jgi:xanthine/CO dehydrogenase XdhC/CoxF family maturation factor
MKELQAIVGRLCTADSGSVLATLVTAEGSSYRRPGARMLVCKGIRTGSISGGCLEEDLVARAARVAASGDAELATYDTSAEDDLLWGVGMGCHGVVRILIEPVPPRPPWAAAVERNLREGTRTRLEVVWENPSGKVGTRLGGPPMGAGAKVLVEDLAPAPSLIIFGAGDDAIPLARHARELGWGVTVADPRAAMATKERFPGMGRLITAPADVLVSQAAPTGGSLAVVMTHHYLHDVPLMRGLLPLPLGYLGLLGPRARAERILSDIAAAGIEVTGAMRARVRAPVGLDLGAEGAEEVALSIIAEMAAVVSGRDARPLRERKQPIHA